MRSTKLLFIIIILSIASFSCVSKKDKQSFKDKTIIITGTSSGLGKSLAELAAQKKMKVVLVDMNFPPSQALAQKINKQGGQAIAIYADLANPEERHHIVDETISQFGTLDYLINNAGYVYITEVENVDLDQAHHLFEVNYWAYLDLATRVIPVMKEQGAGSIINISTVAALEGKRDYKEGIYAASKHALMPTFKTMAHELKKDNINVKIVCPHLMKTNAVVNSLGIDLPADQLRKLQDKVFKNADDPDDIAEEIFQRMYQKEVVILPGKARSIYKDIESVNK